MGSLMGKKTPAPPPPDAPTLMPQAGPATPPTSTTPAAPPVMPNPDDAALAQARRRKLAKDMSRSGRLSTILSDSSETLG